MAGDWIKMEVNLPDKPEVHAIAGMLGVEPDLVVGKLLRVWAWFDQHTEDGNAVGVTIALVDRLTSVVGFGEAMSFAGWLTKNDRTLTVVNFDRHNSESAKKRALSAKRQKKYRNANSNADVTVDALPREEKRREVNTPSFDAFWLAYPKKVAKQDAIKAWRKLNPDELLLNRIMGGLAAAKKSHDWIKDSGQFIPHAATWLNGRRFEDVMIIPQAQERRVSL